MNDIECSANLITYSSADSIENNFDKEKLIMPSFNTTEQPTPELDSDPFIDIIKKSVFCYHFMIGC